MTDTVYDLFARRARSIEKYGTQVRPRSFASGPGLERAHAAARKQARICRADPDRFAKVMRGLRDGRISLDDAEQDRECYV